MVIPRTTPATIAGLALAVVLALPASAARAATQVHYVMGTLLRVDVDGDVAPAVFAPCFAAARALDRTFSRFDPASELVRVNAAGGGPASPSFRAGLDAAMALARATGGTFDVTVGASTALWRRPRPPARGEVAAARASVGDVRIEDDRVTLGAGTRLDFDGLAKGLAVDECVAALRRHGVTRALVSFGESSLYAIGAPRGAAAWSLDVRGIDPAFAVARLALRDEAAAVSSVFGGAGRRTAGGCGHVVDPRSGRCLSDEAVSVVVAPRAADAEAWAKAVLVGGVHDDGLVAARIARDGVALTGPMRERLHVHARPRPLAGEVDLR
jgi:thiamine biosynthesis lipoprotein